jgi:beta-galactosidase
MNHQELAVQKVQGKKIVTVDFNKAIVPSFDYLGIKYTQAATVTAALEQKADVYVFSGLDSANTSAAQIIEIRALLKKGGRILISRSGNFAHQLFPEYIRSIVNTSNEVANIDIPESEIFNGIEPLDIRYFNNNKREKPTVIADAFRINRSANVEPLSSFVKIHGYLSSNVEARMKALDKIKGFPLVKIKEGTGRATLSAILFEKADTDPVAAKLLVNVLTELAK